MSEYGVQLANIPYKEIWNMIKEQAQQAQIESLNIVEFTSISNLIKIFPELENMLIKAQMYGSMEIIPVRENNTIYLVSDGIVIVYEKDQNNLYIACKQFELTECVFNSFNEAFKDIHIKDLKLSNIEDSEYVFDYMFAYLKIDNLDMTKIKFENIVSAEDMFRFAKIKNLKLPKDARNFIQANNNNNMFIQSDIGNIEYKN